MDKFLYRDEKFIAKWAKIREKGFENYRAKESYLSFYAYSSYLAILLISFLLMLEPSSNFHWVYIICFINIYQIYERWKGAKTNWDYAENRYHQLILLPKKE